MGAEAWSGARLAAAHASVLLRPKRAGGVCASQRGQRPSVSFQPQRRDPLCGPSLGLSWSSLWIKWKGVKGQRHGRLRINGCAVLGAPGMGVGGTEGSRREAPARQAAAQICGVAVGPGGNLCFISDSVSPSGKGLQSPFQARGREAPTSSQARGLIKTHRLNRTAEMRPLSRQRD